jgi:calmodulin
VTAIVVFKKNYSGAVAIIPMLTQEETVRCRDAFGLFDKDGSGMIDAWELKEALKAMGQHPTDEEVMQILSGVDGDGSGGIDFVEFLRVIENQKEQAVKATDDSDLLDAFVALGGRSDKSGQIETGKLIRIFNEFELTVDIEKLIEEVRTHELKLHQIRCTFKLTLKFRRTRTEVDL